MKAPRVTVVIPAFNAAATIRRAVDSVLAQTYRDYEIVVIDDGSRDATADIVAMRYGRRVRLLCLACNQGESAAMNEGIAVAEGELIAFLDADDEWLRDKLAKQIAALDRHPDAVMVSCACRFVDLRGNVVREFGMPPSGIDRNQAWRRLLARSFIAKPCVVARRAALREVGQFDTKLAVAADQDMWIRLAMLGPVEVVPEFLTIVHDTAGSLTKVHARKVDKYVLPMIEGHIARQRPRLETWEVRKVLGERFTVVGRNLYRAGSVIRGATLIMRAVSKGYEVPANLRYLVAASPPARALKRLRQPARGEAPHHANRGDARQDRSLLSPDKREIVAVPAANPVLIVMVDAEAEFDCNGPLLRTSISVRNLRRQVEVQDICDRLGVKPTFLVDYAAATRPECFEPIRELLRSGRCAIGAHARTWQNPPFAEELGVRTSFNHNLPAWLQKEKLHRLTDAIGDCFGTQPVAYRAGRCGVGDEIAAILDALGYQIELSVLPGHDLRRCHGPDFRRAFNQPYWFGPGRNLLEIPLTTGFSGLLAGGGDPAVRKASFHAAIARPELTRWHLPGVFARLGLLERITLTPEGVSIDALKRLTRLLLRSGQRVFTLNYHSSALLPGSTPHVRSREDLDRMIHTLEEYLHYFIEELGGVTMTPMEFRAAVLPQTAARSPALPGVFAQ